ncbi:MAG: hypothetical protein GY696_14710, partial [Gammaproteobacteria bacterium]|nr:hypothetical protein [Gammaproteobacteria bacterium]
ETEVFSKTLPTSPWSGFTSDDRIYFFAEATNVPGEVYTGNNKGSDYVDVSYPRPDLYTTINVPESLR